MTTKPVLIAVPLRQGLSEYDPEIVGLVNALAEQALAALSHAGARVQVLDLDAVPTESDPEAESDPGKTLWQSEFDGLLLLGGGDLDPALYGDPSRHPALWGVNSRVDRLELALAREARSAGVPVFGICRGLQVLNVSRGGTLLQHLPDAPLAHRGLPPGPPMVEHDVRIAPDSELGRALGTLDASVRTGHHQGIDRLGAGLTAVAWAADGLVEALEDQATGTIGVQWHPEDPAADPEPLARLCRYFVARASRRGEVAPTTPPPE
jgi:putative glutamine amidotransferase